MTKWVLIFVICCLSFFQLSAAADLGQTLEFSNIDGNRTVRTITPGEGYVPDILNNNRPIRNPHILSQVMWVDRNHMNAIAEDVAITPDGSGIFAGWWLNNMRYASYVSAGLETPVWQYPLTTQWMMPVAASNTKYSGTGNLLPAFIWDKDSPLPSDQVTFDPGYSGAGVAFSGDGSLLATASTPGTGDAMLIVYNVANADTVMVRHFDPTRGLYGVDISDDGSIAVASTYDLLYVFDIPAGNLLASLYNYGQGTAKVSGDGSKVVTGLFSGQVYLYAWNETTYVRQWAKSTRHDWVTAVDISTDGSTVACGTLDFVNNQIAGGKFMWWEAATGDTIYSYSDYGDEVGAVGLSADGRYAVAGCWGKYGTTQGDVLTGFIRDTNVPIFQLLDDIDEPGSIFDVAISQSGNFVAAGGKAVHAREFGNGGMLYSIQLLDPLTHDVAIASIDAPGEFMAPGETTSPTASVINVGTSTESFSVTCTVTNLDSNTVIYNSSSLIENLGSFETAQAIFSPEFTMPTDGRFRIEFSAALSGDQNTANDQLGLILRSWHDVVGVAISSPYEENTVNWALTPVATFKNMGSYTETDDINLSIQDSSGVEVYSARTTIYDLAPYAQEEVQFDGWTPEFTGRYNAIFTALVDGDRTPSDNILTKTFRVVEEMIYDDGIADANFWVGMYDGAATTNRKFAQRFDPNIPAPFVVTNVRFYQPNITFDGIFDYLGVTPETNSEPDTTQYLGFVENPELPGPDNWASYDLNVGQAESQPLWFVIHWPDVPSNGPFIGADNTGTLNGQSYWYTDSLRWNLYPWYDWMIRMTLQPGTGMPIDIVNGLPTRVSLSQNYPNPFNPTTNIQFALPNAANVSVVIYNNLGQKVKTLLNTYFDAGYHAAIWDGKSDAGADVASGVYYYRLIAGDHRISKKMLLMK